jgi:hypothetical protein
MAIRTALVATAVAVLITAAPLAKTAPLRVKKIGNAIREYQDDRIQAVIAYEYSNRYHDGTWLFVDAAVRTTDRLVFHRGDFTLVTPDEKTVVLADESRFIGAAQQINYIRQNSRVWARDLTPYFIDRSISESFPLFALPGEGVVSDSIATDQYGPALLTLYFHSAARNWAAGTYQLRIDNGKARAVIPVELK